MNIKPEQIADIIQQLLDQQAELSRTTVAPLELSDIDALVNEARAVEAAFAPYREAELARLQVELDRLYALRDAWIQRNLTSPPTA